MNLESVGETIDRVASFEPHDQTRDARLVGRFTWHRKKFMYPVRGERAGMSGQKRFKKADFSDPGLHTRNVKNDIRWTNC